MNSTERYHYIIRMDEEKTEREETEAAGVRIAVMDDMVAVGNGGDVTTFSLNELSAEARRFLAAKLD